MPAPKAFIDTKVLLYSEDIQDGLLIDDQLRILNPFTVEASADS